MTDLASLGIRIESQEADVADKRLDDLAVSAGRAEKSVDSLANAARRADGATQMMNVAVAEQSRMLSVSQNAMGLTANEGLNMSRQMADVGVQLAGGVSPFMVAIMQGPQIIDIFALAAARAGTTIVAAMRVAAASAWAAVAPFTPLIAAVTAVAAVTAGSWMLATRAQSKEIGDLTVGMGLNAAQLDRLREKNISTTATAGDVWRGLGTTIGDMFKSVFGDQLDWIDKQWNSFLDDLTANTGKEVDAIAGFFTGAYYVVRDTWKLLPAALGDAAVSGANAAIDGINMLVARSVQGIQKLRDQYNALPGWMRGGQTAPDILAPQIARLADTYSGGMEAVAATSGASYAQGYASRQGMSGRVMDTVRQNTRDSGQARLTAGAGDAERVADAARKAREDIEKLVEVGLKMPDFKGLTDSFVKLPELITYTEVFANQMRMINDLAQDAARGMGSAFGQTGRSLGDVLTTMTDYRSRIAEINLAQEKGAMFAGEADRRRAAATVQSYGDMLAVSKSFFREGSDGYRLLQAAEGAYRVFQFAMAVQGMALTAAETAATVTGAGIEAASVVGAEGIKTGATVAGTAIRTPLKLAEGAASMFAALGPLGFPAVVAMLALLATMGLKGGGGTGGGGSGAAANDNLADSVARSQGQSAQQDQGRQSIFESVAQRVEVKVTADRDGLNAYVVQTAADTARPMVEGGMAAAGGATRAQVMQDLDTGRTYSRSGG